MLRIAPSAISIMVLLVGCSLSEETGGLLDGLPSLDAGADTMGAPDSELDTRADAVQPDAPVTDTRLDACAENACGGSCGPCTGGAVCLDGTCICDLAGVTCCGTDVCALDSCGNQNLVETCPAGCADAACIQVESGCEGGEPWQTFGGGMVGCAGRVTFPQRDSLCSPSFSACSAQQWVALRAATAPTHNYWTSEILQYYGSDGYCLVSATEGYRCQSDDSPMRVCASHGPDPSGNVCNWSGCGYQAREPNEFFGGCDGNLWAGTLCCPR